MCKDNLGIWKFGMKYLHGTLGNVLLIFERCQLLHSICIWINSRVDWTGQPSSRQWRDDPGLQETKIRNDVFLVGMYHLILLPVVKLIRILLTHMAHDIEILCGDIYLQENHGPVPIPSVLSLAPNYSQTIALDGLSYILYLVGLQSPQQDLILKRP